MKVAVAPAFIQKKNWDFRAGVNMAFNDFKKYLIFGSVRFLAWYFSL